MSKIYYIPEEQLVEAMDCLESAGISADMLYEDRIIVYNDYDNATEETLNDIGFDYEFITEY